MDGRVSQSQSSRLKAEPVTPRRPLKRKAAALSSVESEDDDSEDDDAPLASSQGVRSAAVPMPGAVAATTVPASAVNGVKKKANGVKSRPSVPADESSGDDDEPLGTPKAANGKAKVPAKKRAKQKQVEVEEDEDYEMDDKEAPKKKKTKKANGKTKTTKGTKAKKEETSDVEMPSTSTKRKPKASTSQDDGKPKKRGRVKREEEGRGSAMPTSPSKKAKKEEEEAEDQYKWWEAENQENDGSIKWTTLEHNGVIFPPPYEPLPKNVKMKYAGAHPLRYKLASSERLDREACGPSSRVGRGCWVLWCYG